MNQGKVKRVSFSEPFAGNDFEIIVSPRDIFNESFDPFVAQQEDKRNQIQERELKKLKGWSDSPPTLTPRKRRMTQHFESKAESSKAEKKLPPAKITRKRRQTICCTTAEALTDIK